MARFNFTYGNNIRTLIYGSIGPIDFELAPSYQFQSVVIDGVTYKYMIGSIPSYANTTPPTIKFPASPTWDTNTLFGSSTTPSIWTSGQLSVGVTTLWNTSQHGCTFGRVSIGGTQLFQNMPGRYVSQEPDHPLGIFAFSGILRGEIGFYIIPGVDYNTGNPMDWKSIAGFQFVFLSYNCFNTAERQDPYTPGGGEYPDGTPDGGFGSGTPNSGGSSSAGSVPDHPIKSGFGVNYVWMSDEQLADFTAKMWGRDETLFDKLWSKWKNYKFNPMAGILTCHSLPTAFQPTFGAPVSSVAIAGTNINTSAVSISAGIVQREYWQDLSVMVKYGTYLDFTHCRIIAHIPFCGVCELPVAACMYGSVRFIYRCDRLNGNVACWVICYDRDGYEHQVACLTGNCAYVVPITGNDNGMSQIIGALKTGFDGTVQATEGAIKMVGSEGAIGAKDVNEGLGQMRNAGLGVLTAQKHTIVSGNVSGNAAIVSNEHLFIEYYVASPSTPLYMQGVRGLPADIGGTVGSWSGQYVEFSDVHASSIAGATEDEKREIEAALKAGVFV